MLSVYSATNYILDLTAKKIPGLNAETFQIIKDGYTVEPVELSVDESDLCLSLARELSRSGDIEPQVFQDRNRRQILLLFQSL